MEGTDVGWRGYWVASATPFTATGELDESGVAALIDLYVSQGVHGVLINGSTGEWFSQSGDERRRVVEIAVEAADGRLPVVAGVSAYTPDEACALAEHAAATGADGVLATPPPYVHPSPDEIVAFYGAVSSASDLPFMVYNWPRGVSVDMAETPGLMARLADLDQVVAIKDSTGDWLRMLGTVDAVADRVRVFGSFISRRGLAVLLGLGGDGNIDGGGLGAPHAVPFYNAVFTSNAADAEQAALNYGAISGRLITPDYSGIFASPIPQLKAAMTMLGQPAGTPRPPLLPLTDGAALAAIRRILIEGDVLDDAS
jgi:1-pyrroline-4-hydroxy-2-carboxylate deaminase